MKRLLILGFFGFFLFFSLTTLAWVPHRLNYQGRLTDAKGSPITKTTTLRFSLYQGGDATTPGSGTLVYEEDATVTPDSNGVFNHTIGSGKVIFGKLDVSVFHTKYTVFLEITVDPAGLKETLLPRKRIVSVGYSFKSELADDADKVDGKHASAFSPMGHHHDADYVNEGQANSVTSAMIVNGTIMNADINASANIAASKINRTGLDADLLDGKDSLDFVHIADDEMSGTLHVQTYGANRAIYANEYSPGVGGSFGVWGQSHSGTGVYGTATATTDVTHGVAGTTNSPAGRGVAGYAYATSGSAIGVYGRSDSPYGRAVYGTATASTGENYGVYGQSNSTSGRGVLGYAFATSGTNYGVYGASASTKGRGVYGVAVATSGTNYGVYGASNSTYGFGVYGKASALSGTNYGVYGASASNSGRGVSGWASATSGATYGVYGLSDSPSGSGVYGHARATSGYDAYGVYGVSESASGSGIYGHASATIGSTKGVFGRSSSTSGSGVLGISPYKGVDGFATSKSGANYGVYGGSSSTSGYGVYGDAYASSGVNYGVYGTTNSSSGYAGYFEGRVHVTGSLSCDGSKPCVQPIDNGKKVLLYAMESPEIWFEDFGTAQLVNGRAVVPIEKVFAQTVNTGVGYYVFLTPNGECNGLYISRKDRDSFEVRELGGGTSNIGFDYRIVAKRRGYEDVRFEEFTEPEKSPAEEKLPVETKAAKVKQRR